MPITAEDSPTGGGEVEMEVAARDIVVPTYMYNSLQCNLQPNGSFTFVLPVACLSTEAIDLQLRAPDGTEIWSLSSSRQTLGGSNFWDWVANPLIYAQLSFNATAQGEMIRLRGKVIDLQGIHEVSHRQVIIWGQRTGQNTLQPVSLAETDGYGNFFCEYPIGHFDAGKATISGTSSSDLVNPLPIELVADTNNSAFKIFPTFVFLVVTEVKEMPEDCDCHGSNVPRCPDASDLHDNANTYSQDIGGSCVNMTMPNRSLEEFSFFMVVRTTEPQIKGMTLNSYEISRRMANENEPPVIVEGVAQNLFLRAENIPPDMDMNAGYTDRTFLNADNGADWDYTPTIYQAVTISHGHILQYKQIWKADGYSLGDLLFSLPLAPGQKKQIAIFDWDRKEAAIREEEQHYEESLEAYLSHDRDISEITNTALQESMRGGSKSFTAGIGGGRGIGAMVPLEGVMLGVSGGMSGGAGFGGSNAWQDSSRNIAANSLQKLQENIMQSASAVRSQRTTVVQTVNQGESFRVETDSVANYNHCHALTMEYFEILRHFCVEQKLASVQECLFVPLQMSRFDEFKVLRWKESLKKAVAMRFGFNPRRNSLLAAFDALERYVGEKDATAYNLTQYPVGTYADQTILDITGEMEITFRLNRPKDMESIVPGSGNNPPIITYTTDTRNWGIFAFLFGDTPNNIKINLFDNDNKTQAEKNKIFEREIAPKMAQNFIKRLIIQTTDSAGTLSTLLSPGSVFAVGGISISIPLAVAKLDLTQISNYKREVKLRVTIRSTSQAIGLRRNQIDKLLINTGDDLAASEEMSRATINSLTLRYRTAESSGFLCKESFVQNEIAPGDGVAIFCPLSADEMRNPKMEDWLASNKLLQHLNANLETYHHTIWYNMSAERRYMILDGYLAPNGGGKSVASVVENRLLGIVGNSLILPVAPGYKLDPTYTIDPQNPVSLFQHYEPLTPLPPYRVSVPTRGVFAEAIQGACNSCEKIDNTRFWKWEEHPIPDNPTAINSINTPTPVVTEPDVYPSQMPTPMINIQNAPNVPDPQGYNALLQVLGTKGLFDNITGLDANQRNALEAMLSSQAAAQNYASMASQLAQAAAQYKLMEDMKQNIENDIALTSAEKKVKKAEVSKAQLDALKGIQNKSGNLGDFSSGIAQYQQAVDAIEASSLSPEIKQQLQQRLADVFMPPSKEQNAESLLSKGLSGFENLSEVKVQTGDGTSMELKGDSVGEGGLETNTQLPPQFPDLPNNIIIFYNPFAAAPNYRFLRVRIPASISIPSMIVILNDVNGTNAFFNGTLALFGKTQSNNNLSLDITTADLLNPAQGTAKAQFLSNVLGQLNTNTGNIFIQYSNLSGTDTHLFHQFSYLYKLIKIDQNVTINQQNNMVWGDIFGVIPFTTLNIPMPDPNNSSNTLNINPTLLSPMIYDYRNFVNMAGSGNIINDVYVNNNLNPTDFTTDTLVANQLINSTGSWRNRAANITGVFRTDALNTAFTNAEQAALGGVNTLLNNQGNSFLLVVGQISNFNLIIMQNSNITIPFCTIPYTDIRMLGAMRNGVSGQYAADWIGFVQTI